MVFRRQLFQCFSALRESFLKVGDLGFKDVIETDRTCTLHLLSLNLSLVIEAQVPYIYHTIQLTEFIFQSVIVQLLLFQTVIVRLWTIEMKILLSNHSGLKYFLGSVHLTGLSCFSCFIEHILQCKNKKKRIFLWLIFHCILKLCSQISNLFNKCIEYQVFADFCSRACSLTFSRTKSIGGRGYKQVSKSSKARLQQTETRSGAVTYTFQKKLNFWFSLQVEIKKKKKSFYEQEVLNQLHFQIYVASTN